MVEPLMLLARGTIPRLRVRFLSLLALAALLLAALHLFWAGAAVLDPAEISYGESYVLDEALGFLHGRPLYEPLGQTPASINLYGPLFYLLIAAPQAVAGPAFFPGRVTNIALALIGALGVHHVVARQAGNWRAGAFAGALVLALAYPLSVPWYALYRVDLLGVALDIGSVVLLLQLSPLSVVCAGLMAGLAVSAKFTFVTALAAGTVWLAIYARARLPIFLGAAALAVGLVYGWAQFTTGQLVSNTLIGNAVPLDPSTAISNYKALLHFLFAPLAISALFLVEQGYPVDRAKQTTLLLLFWCFSLLCLLEMSKIGANSNYWIELAVASCMLSAMYVLGNAPPRFSVHPNATRTIAQVLLTANLVIAAVPALQNGLPQLSPPAGFRETLNLARNEPGGVLSDPLDIQVLSGHSPVFLPSLLGLLVSTRTLQASVLTETLCAANIAMLVLNYPVEQASIHPWPSSWPPPMAEMLQADFVFERQIGAYYVYRARPQTSIQCARN